MNDSPQTTRILNLLAAAWPGEVPAPALSHISLQYAARIHELRERGWDISNRTEYKAGVRHGFYKLGQPPIPRSKELRAETPEPGSLFDEPPCHRDLG